MCGMYYYGYRRRRRKRTGPKKVKNGIKVRAKRGDLGQGWLAKAWIRALEDAMYSSDSFTRGRTYARLGQVLSVDVKKGSVVAMVQGRARSPYEVRMTMSIPRPIYWKKFASLMVRNPVYAAAILAGHMPEDLSEKMASLGLNLFPIRSGLTVSCECNDWQTMCKHATATCYILAEEFDRDPLLYLKIRGIDRRDFLAMLESDATETPPILPAETPPTLPADVDKSPLSKAVSNSNHAWGAMRGMFGLGSLLPDSDPSVFSPSDTQSEAHAVEKDVLKEPTLILGGLLPEFRIPGVPDVPDERTELPSDPREFWGSSIKVSDSYDTALAPSESAALPKTLGRFPMWRGAGQFITLMEEIYSQASMRGANAYLGIREESSKGASKRAPNGARRK